MVDDLTAFRNWLKLHNTTDVVGLTRDPEHCPVAIYLRDLGHRITSVTRHYQLCGDEIVDNPTWMTDFINQIDKLHKPKDPVTAGGALSVLCHIEAFPCPTA